MTPYYDRAGVTIIHADCRDVVPLLAADVVLTDPPYGYGAYATDVAFDPAMLGAWVGRFATVAAFGYAEMLVDWCVRAGVVPVEWVTWAPTNRWSARGAGLVRVAEHVAVFGRVPGAVRLRRPRAPDAWGRRNSEARGLSATDAREGDVWTDPSPGMGFNAHRRLHPNEKPLVLMQRLVDLCSEPSEAVLDPFCGSGTTLLAARNLGRTAVGVEVEERYCEIAATRLSQSVPPLPEESAS